MTRMLQAVLALILPVGLCHAEVRGLRTVPASTGTAVPVGVYSGSHALVVRASNCTADGSLFFTPDRWRFGAGYVLAGFGW